MIKHKKASRLNINLIKYLKTHKKEPNDLGSFYISLINLLFNKRMILLSSITETLKSNSFTQRTLLNIIPYNNNKNPVNKDYFTYDIKLIL